MDQAFISSHISVQNFIAFLVITEAKAIENSSLCVLQRVRHPKRAHFSKPQKLRDDMEIKSSCARSHEKYSSQQRLRHPLFFYLPNQLLNTFKIAISERSRWPILPTLKSHCGHFQTTPTILQWPGEEKLTNMCSCFTDPSYYDCSTQGTNLRSGSREFRNTGTFGLRPSTDCHANILVRFSFSLCRSF